MRIYAIYSFLVLLLSPLSAFSANQNIKHYKDIVWASPKGFDLTLDIAVPKGGAKAKPVLVIYHGGGWLLNNKSIMTDLADAIASRTDVITVNANYRVLPDLNNTTSVNEQIEDAMGAVLWVKQHIKHYGGDPQKLAVTGDSAGGHLALMVTLAGRNLGSEGFAANSLRFKPTYLPEGVTAEQLAKNDGLKVQAAILSYAALGLVEAAQNGFESEGNIFWTFAQAKPRGLFGDKINVKDNLDYYQAVSSAQYIVSAKDYALPPMFFYVGEQDPIIKPENTRAFVSNLKHLGQPAEFNVYPGKAHGFLDTGCNDYNHGCFKDLSEPAVTDMVAFLNKVFHL